MTQLYHYFVAWILWKATWILFLKNIPEMQEEISYWYDWISEKVDQYF